jgi:hypothetical protein
MDSGKRKGPPGGGGQKAVLQADPRNRVVVSRVCLYAPG